MSHFADINWLAVVLAAIASMVLGMGWYTVLGNQWMAALGKTREDIMPDGKGSPKPFIIAGVCQLIMAYFLVLLTPNYGHQCSGHSNFGCRNCWGAHVVWLYANGHGVEPCLPKPKIVPYHC